MTYVLELSTLYPGPLAGRLLLSQGFRVVKVEPPGGDPLRRISPTLYRWLNEGKEVVEADLRTEEGRRKARELASGAGAVVTSFRPPTAEAFGVSYRSLSVLNPRLLYVAIVGFSTEELRELPGHDVNFAAYAGGAPSVPTPQAVDVATGLYVAFIIASMWGRAGYVEVAMEDVAHLLNLLNYALMRDVGAAPLTGSHPFYNIYKCVGGAVALGAVEEKFWRRFCQMVGRPDWESRMTDPSLTEEVAELLATKSCRELLEEAKRWEVPLTPVRRLEEADWKKAVALLKPSIT